MQIILALMVLENKISLAQAEMILKNLSGKRFGGKTLEEIMQDLKEAGL